MDPHGLLAQATRLLSTGQPGQALEPAEEAVFRLSSASGSSVGALPALCLLGEIQVELGDASAALRTFQAAVALDPEGRIAEEDGGGAEKFMWLAQLCEEGGRESIRWYRKGVEVLERDIAMLPDVPANQEELMDKKQKLAGALGAIIEVWMTDLSLEPEAEQECDTLIDKALTTCQPPLASTLQTLASIRLSQSRVEDAQSALTESLARWEDLPPEHPNIPDFAARISLARLLMEAEMEEEASEVLERLIGEDDESVEAWYLGGWCLWLLASANDASGPDNDSEDEGGRRRSLRLSSREWLRNCLKLHALTNYEDERLKEHAVDLVQGLDRDLGGAEIEDLDDDDGVIDGEGSSEDESEATSDKMDMG